MKAETKYVAFNGTVFDNPEAAKQYETMMYLKTRYQDCKCAVNRISKSVRNSRIHIVYLIEQLASCNTIIRNQSSNEVDIFNAKTKRFKMRIELKLMIPGYINAKNLLREYNRKLSYYYNRIVMETKNQKRVNNLNT